MADRSYLVQKFARINLGAIHLIGYSVAGEETVVQVPELNVCFDIGRCPHFALTSDYVCLTHGHMDHVAGIAFYLSQRYFQGMKPGKVILPASLLRPVDTMLRAWRDIERQNTPYELIPLQAGQDHQVRKDFAIRAYETHHGGPSLGYGLISIREKLKPEYAGLNGPELVQLKRKGLEIQYRLEVPQVVFLGDTTAGPVFEHPDVRTAETLITECTFYDAGHRANAKAGKHLHVEQLVPLLPGLQNHTIVLTHVSRRLGIRRARAILRNLAGEQQMKRILLLMDLEHATDAGDIEQVAPPPANE